MAERQHGAGLEVAGRLGLRRRRVVAGHLSRIVEQHGTVLDDRVDDVDRARVQGQDHPIVLAGNDPGGLAVEHDLGVGLVDEGDGQVVGSHRGTGLAEHRRDDLVRRLGPAQRAAEHGQAAGSPCVAVGQAAALQGLTGEIGEAPDPQPPRRFVVDRFGPGGRDRADGMAPVVAERGRDARGQACSGHVRGELRIAGLAGL